MVSDRDKKSDVSKVDRAKTSRMLYKRLLDLQFELNTYGFLFSSLKECEIGEDDMHGMGVVFKKMAKRVYRISRDLNLDLS